MIIDSVGKWPFPAANDSPDWREISEEHALRLRDCVPPIYVTGGFAVGEQSNTNAVGVGTHAVILCRNNRYFLREMTLREARTAYATLGSELA